MDSSRAAIRWLGTIKHKPATQVEVNTRKYAQSHDPAHAHTEDAEETWWNQLSHYFKWSSHFPSISSLPLFLQETMLWLYTHTHTHTHAHTHTWRHGPSFLSVTLSLPISLSYWQNPIYDRPLGHCAYMCVCACVFLLPAWTCFHNICMSNQVCTVCVHGRGGVCVCVCVCVCSDDAGSPVWRFPVKGNKSRDEASAMRFPG